MVAFDRQEMVKLGKASGRAKLAGTLVGLGGAMVVTFYGGAELGFTHRLARAVGLRRRGGDVGRRPRRGLVPRHRQLLQLRRLALHPGPGRGGLPVPLLHRRAGVPRRRRPVRAARALLPPGRGALAPRPRRQALLVGLRGEQAPPHRRRTRDRSAIAAVFMNRGDDLMQQVPVFLVCRGSWRPGSRSR